MRESEHQNGPRRAGILARWWVVAFVLWMALAARLSGPEVAAGVVAAGLVAATAAFLRPARLIEWRVRGRWLVNVLRLPAQIVHDLGILAVALWRPPRSGSFRALPFDAGGDKPDEAGRRALTALAGSIGPNTFVVGFDVDRQLVLVHQLVRNEQVLPTSGGRYPAS